MSGLHQQTLEEKRHHLSYLAAHLRGVQAGAQEGEVDTLWRVGGEKS